MGRAKARPLASTLGTEMIDWEKKATEYQILITGPFSAAVNERLRTLIGGAASTLPRDTPEALSWFLSALSHKDKKWFVAKVMSMASPMPRTLLEPMLVAGLLERNPSTNRQFIEPCVKTFGGSTVANSLRTLATTLEATEHDGLAQALYWVPGART